MKDFSKEMEEIRFLQEKGEQAIREASENVAESSVKIIQKYRKKLPKEVESFILVMATNYQDQTKATLLHSQGFTHAAEKYCSLVQEHSELRRQFDELRRGAEPAPRQKPVQSRWWGRFIKNFL